MKKFMACALSTCMVAATLVGCDGTTPVTPVDTGDDTGSTTATPDTTEIKVENAVGEINLWAFTDEVPGMVEAYIKNHPDFPYTVKTTVIATTDGAYQPALDQALVAGGKDAPDMYAAESAFVLKYTKGDMSAYAAPYKDLGIDVDNAIKAANIADYTVQIGTNPDGDLVGLGYQATGGAFIYRRSIAKDVWGSDDPATVKAKIGGGSGSWDQYWVAAQELKDKGYAICSGDGDMWHAIENSSDSGWIVDGKLNIDPKREAFMDVSKKLVDGGFHHDTQDWQDGWFADMKADGGVLGFFGPAWLINYTIAPNCGGSAVGEGSYGDWGVTESPIGFFWGGTWVLASKSCIDNGKAEAIGELIYYITLDPTEDGLQYKWANGTLNGEGGTKDTVASGTVMSVSNGELEFLAGQNMFDVFVPANANAKGDNLTQYDETINGYWREQVRFYAHGDKSKEDAIKDFKQNVADNLDIIVE